MLLRDTKVNQGGLMRCCTGTLSQHVGENHEEEVEEGAVLPCEYCSELMILEFIAGEGVWRWNKEQRELQLA